MSNDQRAIVLTVLSRHIGRGNGIGGKQLATEAGVESRQVRKLVSELRREGHAVCAHPKTGYYMAATADDVEHTYQFLTNRSMHGLVDAYYLKKIPLPDLLGQLHLPT
jgi:biotin operon repressor